MRSGMREVGSRPDSNDTESEGIAGSGAKLDCGGEAAEHMFGRPAWDFGQASNHRCFLTRPLILGQERKSGRRYPVSIICVFLASCENLPLLPRQSTAHTR